MNSGPIGSERDRRDDSKLTSEGQLRVRATFSATNIQLSATDSDYAALAWE